MTEKDISGDEKFLSALTEVIFESSSSWFGEQAVKIKFEKIIKRRYSFLFKVRVGFPNLSDLRLVIKIPRMPWMERLDEVVTNEKLRHEARMESDILGRIYLSVQGAENDSLAAIRVYGHLPDFCAIVMEDLPFDLLKNTITGHRLLFVSREKWRSFLEKVGQSANWLRLFHELDRMEPGTRLQDTEILNVADTAFQRLETVSGLDLTEIKNQLNQMYETVVDEPVQQAYLHNDFHLGNIFTTKTGKIGSFDPNWETIGPKLVDVARILIDLETRRIQVLTFGVFLSKRRNEEFKSSFVKEYFQNISVEENLVRYFCVLEVIKKWRVNEDYFASDNINGGVFLKSILHYWYRRYFKHLIKQYITDGF